MPGLARRRSSGVRDALAHAAERLTLGGGGSPKRTSHTAVPQSADGGDEDDDLAILKAAAAFGGGGSRTSLSARPSLSGRLSASGGGRRASGTQFQQAQRRVSATRRVSHGSVISGISGFGDDDDDMVMIGGDATTGSCIPSSIQIGSSGQPVQQRGQATTAQSVEEQSSLAVNAAVAAAQAQAAAQFSAGMALAGGGGEPRTAEEILAQHRLEDAILAREEAAIRSRREQLELLREQEDRLKALELMAAAKVMTPVATATSSAVKPTSAMPAASLPSPLDILAEASAAATATATAETTGAATAKGNAPSNGTAVAAEQQLLLDAMEKYQQQR